MSSSLPPETGRLRALGARGCLTRPKPSVMTDLAQTLEGALAREIRSAPLAV